MKKKSSQASLHRHTRENPLKEGQLLELRWAIEKNFVCESRLLTHEILLYSIVNSSLQVEELAFFKWIFFGCGNIE